MQKDYGCINNLFLFIFQTTSLDACSQVPAINGGGGTSSQVRLEFIAASGTLTAGQATEMLGSENVAAFLMFDAEL